MPFKVSTCVLFAIFSYPILVGVFVLLTTPKIPAWYEPACEIVALDSFNNTDLRNFVECAPRAELACSLNAYWFSTDHRLVDYTPKLSSHLGCTESYPALTHTAFSEVYPRLGMVVKILLLIPLLFLHIAEFLVNIVVFLVNIVVFLVKLPYIIAGVINAAILGFIALVAYKVGAIIYGAVSWLTGLLPIWLTNIVAQILYYISMPFRWLGAGLAYLLQFILWITLLPLRATFFVIGVTLAIIYFVPATLVHVTLCLYLPRTLLLAYTASISPVLFTELLLLVVLSCLFSMFKSKSKTQ